MSDRTLSTEPDAVAEPLRHFGDPCVHCGIPHDEIPVGPCQGDRSKAVPMRWRSLGVRWDNVEHFLIQMSDGSYKERWEHISMALPWTYLKEVRNDPSMQRTTL